MNNWSWRRKIWSSRWGSSDIRSSRDCHPDYSATARDWRISRRLIHPSSRRTKMQAILQCWAPSLSKFRKSRKMPSSSMTFWISMSPNLTSGRMSRWMMRSATTASRLDPPWTASTSHSADWRASEELADWDQDLRWRCPHWTKRSVVSILMAFHLPINIPDRSTSKNSSSSEPPASFVALFYARSCC